MKIFQSERRGTDRDTLAAAMKQISRILLFASTSAAERPRPWNR